MKRQLQFFALIMILFITSQAAISQTKSSKDSFTNPIFAGDYPDPSILRDDSDYYIVHSSFVYYPGLIIWHSKNLVNWTPITAALHTSVGSVWAPDLVKYFGKYYIYFYANGTNYVVWANDISGPWSEPIDLKIGHIDPGHIVDNDGKRYLYMSDGDYVPLSPDGLRIIGPFKKAYDGWPIPSDWSIECFCLEGPKLSKVGKYFYMLSAEGGTAGPATSHMVVAARSKSALGPWENSPYNPIVHTKDHTEKWWSKGHATLVDDINGKWYIVYHGYEKGYYNMGRQTLLEQIEWTSDGWFKTLKGAKMDQPMKSPLGSSGKNSRKISDNFTGENLGLQWQFYKEFDKNRFTIKNNGIELTSKGNSIETSFPLLVQTADHSYSAQVEMQIEGDATGALVLFYDKGACAGIGADNKDIKWILKELISPIETGKSNRHVFLRIENIESQVKLFYSADGSKWNKISNSFESSSFNHNAFGGFLSLRIGLCAVGKGKVTFKNFKYTAIK